jgi:uracil-DNA glycosylase
MASEDFRAEQLAALYAPHVKALNKLVDEFSSGSGRWMPHVAPLHGGVQARLLWLSSDPGPLPEGAGRPYDGLLSVENDDADSARIGALLKRAGIEAGQTCPWNAYPWYTDHEPTAAQIRAGLEPLRRMLNLLERVEVLVLLGSVAERSWRSFLSTYPEDTGWFTVLTTHGIGEDALAGTNAQRHLLREEQAEVFLEAGRLLREG